MRQSLENLLRGPGMRTIVECQHDLAVVQIQCLWKMLRADLKPDRIHLEDA